MIPLLYTPPISVDMWLAWGATHQQDHADIAQNIWNKRGIMIPTLPLDPVPLDNQAAMLIWFQNHAAMHVAMNAVMGVQGSDLSYADLRDPERSAVWINYNAYEHQQIAAAIAAFQPPPVSRQPQAQAVMPQPGGVQPQPTPGTQFGILPQAPTVQTQPAPAVQPQPNPALQPQPSPLPMPGPQPGTPVPPGG